MSGHPHAIVPCQRKREKRKQHFFKSVLKRALFFSKKGSGRVFLLNEDLKFPEWEYNSMVYQPYRLQPSFSAKRIYQWYGYFDGRIYVSFSGGLDSTIWLSWSARLTGNILWKVRCVWSSRIQVRNSRKYGRLPAAMRSV